MKLAIQKALILILPFVVLFLGIFAFYEFKTYNPASDLKSEGAVAGEKTQKFDLKYPNSKTISQSILQGNVSITQQIAANPNEILRYYKSMLTQNGWEVVTPAIYKKGNETITLTLTKDSNNITVVNVDRYSAVPAK